MNWCNMARICILEHDRFRCLMMQKQLLITYQILPWILSEIFSSTSSGPKSHSEFRDYEIKLDVDVH